MSDVVQITRSTLIDFCLDFLKHPYLCYTEHGMHALFFTRLYGALAAEDRYSELLGQQFCVVQKEYPTAGNLGRSRRQHWDVSVIRRPVVAPVRTSAFDYLPLAAVVEFGLNCDSNHLVDDIQRLSHPDSNVQNGFVVHLYRLSNSKEKFSGRDLSPDTTILFDKQSVQTVLNNYKEPPWLEVLYGIADSTKAYKSGLWSITKQGVKDIDFVQ